jgi:glycerate 2-kinase
MTYIRNREALLANGNADARRLALDIAEEAIAAADPGLAVRRAMSISSTALKIGDSEYVLDEGTRIFVIGAGKATFPIAQAIEQILGDRIYKGFVTCKRGQHGALWHIEMTLASHPVPDAASLEAARRTRALLEEVRAGDIVLSCFTGGSSSLFVSPVEGVTLEEKARTTEILLTCGANIVEINDVRKHLSTVKGGRLIEKLPAGTRIVNLTVSDVIGDALDYITDPTVPDRSSFEDARGVLDKYRLWDRLPFAVTTFLRVGAAHHETVRETALQHLEISNELLVRTDAACVGAVQAAQRRGLRAVLLSTFFEGESSALGRNLAAIGRQIKLDGQPLKPPCILVGGGETTVTTNGARGMGGPNQEFATSAALELAGEPGIVVIGMDTDGTDGPTAYAGALADGATVDLAKAHGVDLYGALARHDVTPALEASHHAIETGATGTNVNDLKLVLIV